MAKVIGFALTLFGTITGQPWFTVAGQVLLVGDAYEQNRRAKRRALALYNASLQDRLEMVERDPQQARTIVMGRVRCVEGVRRAWVSGDNSQKLTMVISFAGHEIDAFEQFYFNDIPLTLDGSGYVQTEPFTKGERNTYTTATVAADGTGYADVTVTSGWLAGPGVYGVTADGAVLDLAYTVVGDVFTIGPTTPGVECYVTYQLSTGASTARIRTWLGAPGQNVGSDIAADYPGNITADDKFEGIAVAVVDIDYDPDVYPQGRPNVTAVLRGAKIYDPREDDTAGGSGSQRIADSTTWAWSENNALCAYHYARHVNGWNVPAAEIMPAADIADEADICDVSTDFTLRMPDTTTTTVTLPRYRCGIVISTAGDPRSSMDEIMESMAGRHGWAGGVWKFRAGHMPAPVFDMDESWLARPLGADGTTDGGPTLQFSNGTPRDQKVNRVTGSCVDPSQRYQVLPFPAVEDATLISDDGAVYALEVEYQGVNHVAHAQHLGTIAIRRAQASLKLSASCNLFAYTTELFDVGTLSLTRYGMTDKTMEVKGWRWSPTEGVQLSMCEITEAIFDPVAELTGVDPAPNSNLPNPWDVEDLTGLAVDSGTVALTDGSILTRTQITWDAAVGESIRNGGKVQVQYVEASPTLPDDWPLWEEAGSSESAIIPALKAGTIYLFRARFVSAAPLGVRGKWSLQVAHQIADVPEIGQVLVLKANGFAFVFPDAAATTTTAPTITFDVVTTLPGTATFTTTAYNAGGSSLGTITLGGSGNTGRTLTSTQFNNSGAWATRYVTVVASLGGFDDSTTIYRADEGSDSLLVGQTNEAALVAANSSGTVSSYSGTGTIIGVFEGVTQLTYDGSGTTAAHWTVTASGGGNITPGSIAASGLNAAVADHSSMAAVDVASITYTVSGKTVFGVSFSRTLIQTIAKAKAGATGSTGATGATGATGTTGTSAARAYALYTGNPTVTGSAVVKSGTTLPATTDFSPTAATSFTSTVQTPSSGQAMFQSDGLYNAATNKTTWGTPYLSNLKVGNLAALSAVIDGTQSVSLPDPSSLSTGSITFALAANTSLASDAGLLGESSVALRPGVYGYNTTSSGSGGIGTFGYGFTGVLGKALSSSTGVGVSGWAATGSGSIGINGVGGGSGTYGVYGRTPFAGGGTAVVADASSGGVGLQVIGTSTYSGVMTNTVYTGTAPFTISSTTAVSNLNADLLDDEHASGLVKSVGAVRASLGNTTTSSGGNIAFSGTTKPGSTQGGANQVWLEYRQGSSVFWVPAWAD